MIKIFVQVDQDPALHCSLHVLLHHHGRGPGQVQDHSPVTEETGHTIEMSLSESIKQDGLSSVKLSAA